MDLLDHMRAYRRRASWAVWDYPTVNGSDPALSSSAWVKDTDVIAGASLAGRLTEEVVLVSLNPASRWSRTKDSVADWAAFHDSPTDAKLALAVRDTAAAGAFITDFVPDWSETSSVTVRARLDQEPARVANYVNGLREQVDLLGNPRIVCMHSAVSAYLKQHYWGDPDDLVHIYHYSHYRDGFDDPMTYRRHVHERFRKAGLRTRADDSPA